MRYLEYGLSRPRDDRRRVHPNHDNLLQKRYAEVNARRATGSADG